MLSPVALIKALQTYTLREMHFNGPYSICKIGTELCAGTVTVPDSLKDF
jgi:hypothetical protein